MYNIEIKKTYLPDEVHERSSHSRYANDMYAIIRTMILEDMIMQTLPLKITLDTGEEVNERKTEI